MDDWNPIQVKQKDKAGRPDIDMFESAMRRQDREVGYFISFGFTSDAYKEIERLREKRDQGLEIHPLTVDEILAAEVRLRI